jgi:hypothetical protein
VNRIERFFVRAKHWQIFLLFILLGIASEFPVLGNFAAVESPEGYGTALVLTEVLTAIAVWCFLLWLWSVGSFLTAVAPATLRLKKTFFLYTLAFTAIYVPVSVALFQSINPKLFVITTPLHLLAVFCMFCNLYFVAEGLVMAETGKRPSFLDCAGPFFLIWFFLIGVWFIQPRVNRIYAEKRRADATA